MLRIRIKMTVLPMIGIMIPLVAGILYVLRIANTRYEERVGVLYLTIANEMADDLEQDVLSELILLRRWAKHAGLREQLLLCNKTPLNPEEVRLKDEQWASLSESDPQLREVLDNAMARTLQLFQKINPLFAELMLTDRYGRLAAATNPTTDYWQADEAWWQESANSKSARLAWAKGITFDESAGIQSLDLTLPMFNDEGELQGVLKGSLHAVDVFKRLAPDPWNQEIIRDILLHDGTVLARLNNPGETNTSPARAESSALASLNHTSPGWNVVRLFGNERSIATCVAVGLRDQSGALENRDQAIYMLVHRNYNAAMEPVRELIQNLMLRGLLALVLTGCIAYLIATYWFVHPLGKLQKAVASISEYISRQEHGKIDDVRKDLSEVQASLTTLDSIQTRDEIEELSGVFSHLGRRVLSFHRLLEQELMRKTEEIHEDLVIAREFQEALLPDHYPEVSCQTADGEMMLKFNHVYRPAQSVSGDFFDVTEISGNRVRVFVADVMGHGARSALMTAILHSQLYSASEVDGDPSLLLRRMNGEFHALGVRTGEMIFVTAAHLIIDLGEGTVRCAVAGHPSPLVVDLGSGSVLPLVDPDRPSPAVGLFEDSVYEMAEVPISGEQTILLFTDGITEAENLNDEEFGTERLMQAAAQWCSERSTRPLPDFICELIDAFMDTATAQDDICLLSVDISDSKPAIVQG